LDIRDYEGIQRVLKQYLGYAFFAFILSLLVAIFRWKKNKNGLKNNINVEKILYFKFISLLSQTQFMGILYLCAYGGSNQKNVLKHTELSSTL
jgi:hypothetical protein